MKKQVKLCLAAIVFLSGWILSPSTALPSEQFSWQALQNTYSDSMLDASPLVLDFLIVEGQENDDGSSKKEVTIKHQGADPLSWTASEDIPWVELNKTSGLTPDSIEVSLANVSELEPNGYEGVITISSGEQQIEVNILLFVRPAPEVDEPILDIGGNELSFMTKNSADARQTTSDSQTIIIANAGSGTLNWTATEEIPWLTLSDTSGNATQDSSSKLTITVDGTGLQAGQYEGNITINAKNAKDSPQTIKATLIVFAADTGDELSVETDLLTFSAFLDNDDTLTQTVYVTTKGQWVAKASEAWVIIHQGHGNGDGEFAVHVEVDEFEKTGTHTASITVQTGSNSARVAVIALITEGEEDQPEEDPDYEDFEFDLEDDGKVIELDNDGVAMIRLASNPSTGNTWMLDESSSRQDGSSAIYQASETIDRGEDPDEIMGAPVTQTFRLNPIASGETTVKFQQQGVDGQRRTNKTFSVRLKTKGDFSNVKRPGPTPTPAPERVAPYVAPGEQVDASPANRRRASERQASFNWCDKGGCTPVKSQGQCGSCWSFTTAAMVESSILIKDKVTRDLSEQALLSCNTFTYSNGDSYSCNGGWWAYDHYIDKPMKLGNAPGAIYELTFPYKGNTNTACQPNLSAANNEKLLSWHYIDTPAGSKIASVNAIKQALQQYGPVGTSMCVGSKFYKYRSGVFATNESAACGGKSNHAVIITGWNDNDGAWIVRNSWGANWGKKGYFRIKYGTSSIGYRANYVVYQGNPNATPTQKPSIPTNLTATRNKDQVTLNWTASTHNPTGYELERFRNGTWKMFDTVAANVTTYVHKNVTCNINYQYRVRATGANGKSDYSNTVSVQTEGCAGLKVPTNLVAKGEANKITLSWNNPNSNRVRQSSGVEIFRWNGVDKWVRIGSVGSNVSTYSDTQGVKAGQAYQYAVRTFKGNQYSNFSAAVTGKLAEIKVNTPTNLKATAVSTNGVKLTWKDNSSIEGNFVIRRWDSATKGWAEVGRTGANVTSYQDRNAQCGRTYQYEVVAVADGNFSGYSNVPKITLTCKAPQSTYLPLIQK